MSESMRLDWDSRCRDISAACFSMADDIKAAAKNGDAQDLAPMVAELAEHINVLAALVQMLSPKYNK